MKLCISAQGTDLEAMVDPRFGRCAWFLMIDTETASVEAIENAGVSSPGGAGVGAAQLVAEKGCKAVITGNLGPKAHATLAAAGIKAYGFEGKAKDALEAFTNGKLVRLNGPSKESHSGGKW